MQLPSRKGGAALGGFAGGAIGTYFGPAGTIPGRRVGASFGAAGGAALGAAFCPDTPPDSGEFPFSPAPGPAFGNCDGVQYGGALEYTRSDGLVQISGTGLLWGPVTGIDFRPNGQGGNVISAICRGAGFQPIKPPGSLVPMVDGGAGETYTAARFLNLDRQDGGAECPPPPQDPTIPGVPDDIPPFRDDPFARRPIDVDVDFGGPTVNINGDIVLDGPDLGPCGNIEICFEFDGIRFCIDPFGGIRIGPGARGRNDPPTGDPPPPQDDPRRVLSGVFYSVTDISQGQSFESIGSEKYFYPRFGAVTFTGKGQKSQPIEMRSENGFVQNPAPTYFDGWEFDGYLAGNDASFEELWDLVAAPPTPEIAA